jgi:transcriptional regulator with XRE-family HTH domain
MPPKPPKRHGLSYQLREIIGSRGLSGYAVAHLAGLDPGVVSRWLAGKRDVRLETADAIATALGLRLTETTRWKPAPTRPVPSKPARRRMTTTGGSKPAGAVIPNHTDGRENGVKTSMGEAGKPGASKEGRAETGRGQGEGVVTPPIVGS